MYSGDAPSAFKMPISRVRSSTAVYMVERTIKKPNHHAQADNYPNERGQHGNVRGREETGVILHRIDFVGLQFSRKLGDHGWDVRGVVHLHVDGADLSGISGEVLQRGERHHHARQHARFKDSRDTPRVIRVVDGVADMEIVLAGVYRVHHDIIRAVGRGRRAEIGIRR